MYSSMNPILFLLPNIVGYLSLPIMRYFSSAYRSNLFLCLGYLNSSALCFQRYFTSLDSSNSIVSASAGGMFSLNCFNLIEYNFFTQLYMRLVCPEGFE